jgi:hypothetical protein
MVIHISITDHRTVNVGVMYNRSVYIHYRGIITEVVSGPSSAAITVTTVTVTIIDAAVKSHFGTPVTGMEPIKTTGVTPVWRSPVKSGIRRGYPYTGNPVVTIVIVIGPITWLPKVPIFRACGLHINR